ncbi:MAG: hypothetical protein K2X82_11595 [Gemmataceae bacterium]|nr:hypothetical protein [Gemmataceae bacterium]
MGASSWRYYTPHRPDPGVALQELRDRVFARKEFSMGFGGFARADGPDAPVPDVPTGPDLFREAAATMSGSEGRALRAALDGDFAGLTRREREAAEQMFAEFHDDDRPEFPPGHQPRSIDELLEMVAEDGTHSVLDILDVGRRRGLGVAAPLPATLMARYFPSGRPTKSRVEQYWMDVSEALDRWEACYLTVYLKGEPRWYAFIGCSGD